MRSMVAAPAAEVLLLIAGCLMASAAGAAPQYGFVDFFPNGSRPSTDAKATSAYLTAAGPRQVGYNLFGTGYLWSGTPASALILTPPGYSASVIFGGYATSAGGEQVGQAYGPNSWRAALWRGSADSFVDLGGGTVYGGYDTPNGSRQVGRGNSALLWSGSAASLVDLGPTGTTASAAYGGYAGRGIEQQVGYAFGPATGNRDHAFLWSGTVASALDLHPAGYALSNANGGAVTADGQTWQVGWATANPIGGIKIDSRAILWSGTAASAKDITPAGYPWAAAYATNGNLIVGEGNGHALLWTGPDAADVVDLNQFLPTGYTGAGALGVDAAGNVVGYAAVGDPSPNVGTGYYTAVEWVALPEPEIGLPLILSMIWRLGARRCRARQIARRPEGREGLAALGGSS